MIAVLKRKVFLLVIIHELFKIRSISCREFREPCRNLLGSSELLGCRVSDVYKKKAIWLIECCLFILSIIDTLFEDDESLEDIKRVVYIGESEEFLC